MTEITNMQCKTNICTGKSLSETLILESVNPQYDDRLFMDY